MQRKRYSQEFKDQIVKESLEVGNAAIVARKNDLSANMVSRWVREQKNQNSIGIGAIPVRIGSHNQSTKALESENEKLKKLLGEKDLEIAILKDLVKKNEPTIQDKVDIASKWISKGYCVTLVLRLVGLSRSTYYYYLKHPTAAPNHRGGRPTTSSTCTSDGRIVSNEQVKEWLCELIFAEGEYYGYHKLTWALRRKYQLMINKKKVYRLCKELDILKPQRKLKVKHPRRLARNQEIIASNRLWEIDLKYGYIAGENRFFYILPVIDVFDRVIVDYHIGLNCTAQDAARTVQAAMFKRQTYNAGGLIIRSDNGPQFISRHFEESCIKFGIEHERIPCRTPNKNAHIESFNAILEEECLSKHEFLSYAEAYDMVSQFIKTYNAVRIHSSLKYHTPNEAYRLLQQKSLQIQPVRV